MAIRVVADLRGRLGLEAASSTLAALLLGLGAAIALYYCVEAPLERWIRGVRLRPEMSDAACTR